MPQPASPTKPAEAPAWPALLLALFMTVAMGLRAMPWGLPSAERNRLIYGARSSPNEWPALSAADLDRLWKDYPNYLPGGPERTGRYARSQFNALRTFHPDEHVIFKGLAQMRPRELEMFPGLFAWPAAQFYVVGASLQAARWMGQVDLVRDVTYYLAHPVEMARMYAVGRLTTLVMALIAIVTTWRTALRLFGRGAATATALFLAVTPVFAANARYLTADAPMLCWVAVATWASSHILTGGGRRWYALAGVAVGLAAGTRYQGALASVVVFAGHVFRMDPHRQRHRQPMRALHTLSHIFMDSHIWLAGITSVATFLALNPYVLVLLDQFQHEFTQELRSAGVASGSGLFRAGQFAWFGWGPALTAAAAVGLLYAMARRTRADWFVVWGFVPGLAFLWSTQPVMVRYLMPAALLPALLAARLAAGWAASMNAGARFLGPLMGLVVFGAGAMQCLAFTESCARADPRMEAGKWIEANAPDGAVIAVLADPGAALRVPADQLPPADPWVFQLPPLDAKRFKLKGLRLAVADLDRATPDFVVLGEFQTPPLANREPLTPDESALMEALQDTRRFEPLGFPNEPRILGFSFGLLPAPHDVRYPDPGITVFRRVRSESR